MAPKKSTGKIRIIVRSFDQAIINQATTSIIEAIEKSGAIIAGPIPMPTKIRKYTVNKSTFVNKDAREQFEIRTHKRLIDISNPTNETISTLKTLALPSGVDTEIKMLNE
ncbi:30S ribosomal protein S10 [Candidatus Gracilibacteria bacterium]|nr:30S ribosomal protein S10 [Candidatus Gracilibacteria bacterium]